MSYNVCHNCGNDLVGDGYTTALHCESVDVPVDREPDASPLYCSYPYTKEELKVLTDAEEYRVTIEDYDVEPGEK